MDENIIIDQYETKFRITEQNPYQNARKNLMAMLVTLYVDSVRSKRKEEVNKVIAGLQVDTLTGNIELPVSGM